FLAIGTRPDREIAVTLLRGGETMSLGVRSESQGRYEVGDIGVLPDVNPSVRSVVQGDPADRAGVKPGDVVVAVDGERVVFTQQLADAISEKAGQEIDLTIMRDGQEQHIRVTPEQQGDRGMI